MATNDFMSGNQYRPYLYFPDSKTYYPLPQHNHAAPKKARSAPPLRISNGKFASRPFDQQHVPFTTVLWPTENQQRDKDSLAARSRRWAAAVPKVARCLFYPGRGYEKLEECMQVDDEDTDEEDDAS